MERAFRFVQFEFPWTLGPADGRYVLRDPDVALAEGDDTGERAAATHVLVLATLGAPERRRLGRRRMDDAQPEPEPMPVTTTRVTTIDAHPTALADAEAWLAAAGLATAETALATVARAVRAHRIASGDPSVHEPALAQALVVRAGYGAGEQVAGGRWSAARALDTTPRRQVRRLLALRPQERLAELLGGRAAPFACEELTLRARHDVDHGQLREAALQLRLAFEAALAELPATAKPAGSAASDGDATRIAELRTLAPQVAALAHEALGGVLPPDAGETLASALGRLEAALRARAASEA